LESFVQWFFKWSILLCILEDLKTKRDLPLLSGVSDLISEPSSCNMSWKICLIKTRFYDEFSLLRVAYLESYLQSSDILVPWYLLNLVLYNEDNVMIVNIYLFIENDLACKESYIVSVLREEQRITDYSREFWPYFY
jgi:hypothetical protein